MMKLSFLAVIFVLWPALGCVTPDILEGEFFADRYVLILKSTKDCDEAVSVAMKAHEKLGLAYDNEHVLCSKNKGIYFAQTLPDDDYAGKYYPRRYGDDYISLENSSRYDGFAPGYIIVIAGMFPDESSARAALLKARDVYKDAYVKKTTMFMGCLH